MIVNCTVCHWNIGCNIVSFDVVWYFCIFIDRKLDLKIISEGNTEYTSVQLFSNEDGSPAGRVLIAIIVSSVHVLIMWDYSYPGIN